MVSTTEIFTCESPISPITSTPVKKPSAQKSLCLFTKIFEVKKKTAYCQVGSAKSKRKAIKFGNKPRTLKKSEKGIQKLMNR